MRLLIEKYLNTRFYALYDLDAEASPLYGQLVAVFVYKTGALAVKARLEDLERRLRGASEGD